MTTISEFPVSRRAAVRDDAHSGDIKGALGTIMHGAFAPRMGWTARLRTLLAIIGPGLRLRGSPGRSSNRRPPVAVVSFPTRSAGSRQPTRQGQL